MYSILNESDDNSTLKDVLNFASDILHGRKDKHIKREKNSYTSIARATKDLIAVYPVCGSNTLSINSLSMVTKAIERKGVTMLQLLLAAKNLTDSRDGIEYLKQFHNNLNIRSSLPSVDEWINIMNSVSKSMMEGTDIVLTREATERFVNWLKYENNIILPESLNEHSIQDFKVTESSTGYKVSFIPLSEDINEYDIPHPDRYVDSMGNFYKDSYDVGRMHYSDQLGYEEYRASKDDSDRRYDFEREKLKSSQKDFGRRFGFDKAKARADMKDKDRRYNFEREKYNTSKADSDRSYDLEKDRFALNKQAAQRDTERGDFDYLSKQLMDNDVKKANELVPSLLIVRFTNVETGVATTFIIGVKAKLISCSSFELLDRITKKNRDNRGLVKLIRATTGELGFWKDFILGIDDAKIDTLSKSNKGSKSEMWRVLERRSYKSRRNIQRGSGNDSSAITTMVVSQQEVEYLMKQYSMDMENISTVQTVMNSYNLLCFCIVDESLEIARFFFDGDDDFEDLSFDALQRESGGDGMYKKVLNLMSRINN